MEEEQGTERWLHLSGKLAGIACIDADRSGFDY
jgi:hypothetical protein